MRLLRVAFLFGFFLFSIVPCFAHHMAVVVNQGNGAADVSSAHLSKIFRLEVRKWQDGTDIVVVLHKNSSGELQTLEHLSHMSADELTSFISTHQDAITMVDSDADVLHAVETTRGAVGLVDVRSINDQVNVLKVGGKLPMEEGYLPH
jgi:ABC-type phosphate transport system substrate-binding protein